ncbi:hypothetical protein L218DRAFT_946000 [Marasmius fiardii PR-910]|nr:hypothetical protein L218DRAFT_946000 [Marasmius fiardii PR-910]
MHNVRVLIQLYPQNQLTSWLLPTAIPDSRRSGSYEPRAEKAAAFQVFTSSLDSFMAMSRHRVIQLQNASDAGRKRSMKIVNVHGRQSEQYSGRSSANYRSMERAMKLRTRTVAYWLRINVFEYQAAVVKRETTVPDTSTGQPRLAQVPDLGTQIIQREELVAKREPE